jgi:hypothetical protein
VKGHSDKVKKYHQLSVPEKLNIAADQLASEMLAQVCQQEVDIPRYSLPQCKAYLLNGLHTVSSSEMNLTRWKWSEFQFQGYFTRKHQISLETLHDINWAGVRLARQRFPHHLNMFWSKLSHDWLPTGNVLERQGTVGACCPYCSLPEDTDHLLKCSERRRYITAIHEKFRMYMIKIKTDPKLRCIINNMIEEWLSQASPSYDPDSSDPYILSRIAQERIGVRLFFRGYVTTSWASIQDSFYDNNHEKGLGDSWSSKVTSWWVTELHEIWKLRNEKYHDPNKEQPGVSTEVLQQSVELLYQQQPLLPHQDQVLLDAPIATQLRRRKSSLAAWVASTKTTINACIANMKHRMVQEHRDIRSYFSNTNPDNPEATSILAAPVNERTTINNTNLSQQEDVANNKHHRSTQQLISRFFTRRSISVENSETTLHA